MSKFSLDQIDTAGFGRKLDAAGRSALGVARADDEIVSAAKSLVSQFAAIAEAAKNMASNSSAASSVASGSSSTVAAADQAGQAGQMASMIGSQMSAALNQGLAPLNNIAAKLGEQFNKVGGTITTLARRIDGAMKAPALDAFLVKIKDHMPNAFLKVGVEGVRLFERIKSSLSSMGDVAGKSLDKLSKTKLDQPAASAGVVGQALNTVNTTARAATSSVQSFGRELLIAAGVFGLAYKVVGFFQAGIKGAMSLNETVSASQQVFAGSFGAVKTQTDAMAKSFGFSKDELLKGSNAFGELAQGAKYSETESAKFANTFTKLAGDLTSNKDIPFEDSLHKLRSALAGESEPLRAFGVMIDENAVKLKAVSMGLARSGNELGNHAKMAARAALITEGLSKVSGDLERTQFSTANQFRKAGGGIENFATTIGQMLMPAVDVAIMGFNEFLSTVIEVFQANLPTIEGWVAAVKNGFETVAFVVRNIGSIFQIMVLKAQEAFGNLVAILATIPENFMIITAYIGRNWELLLGDLVVGAGTAFTNLLENATNFGKALWDAIQGKGFTFEFTPLLKGFKALAEEAPKLMEPAWVSMQKEIDAVGLEVAKKEEARAKALAKTAEPMQAAKAAESSGGEAKFAGLAERNSKEAYQAIIKHQAGASTDPQKEVAKATKATAENTKRIANSLEKLPSASAGAAFSF